MGVLTSSGDITVNGGQLTGIGATDTTSFGVYAPSGTIAVNSGSLIGKAATEDMNFAVMAKTITPATDVVVKCNIGGNTGYKDIANIATHADLSLNTVYELSLIHIYFKAVNDNYGHLCGDSVLSDVAAALKGNVRSGGLVGRIGGDEFLVYLPEVTEEATVRHKTAQIMQALSCIRPEAGAQNITCSIGVAVLPRSQNDYEALYQAADSALYRQKNNGRNGFAFYKPQMGETITSQSLTAVGNSIVSDEGNVDVYKRQESTRSMLF